MLGDGTESVHIMMILLFMVLILAIVPMAILAGLAADVLECSWGKYNALSNTNISN